MRILLTRAQADAERTAERLTQLGHKSIVSPVIEIVAASAAIPAGNFDAVIATSAHAFARTNVASLLHLPLYVVGERTCEAVRDCGWRGAIDVSANAQALIARIRGDGSLKNLLYLAGRDRKPDIEAAAREIGLDLHVIETYIAQDASSLSENAKDAMRSGDIDAVLHYSRRSAELFIALAQRAALWPNATKLRHLAISEDAAAPLIAAGASAQAAASPDEAHLLTLLRAAARR
ncbi:MAG: uroporphyrinogen-III synthase [Methylobacteriaceae bacterium]|nr:uroporphyrinogen-III synthase [Methylobacteriaceae bacterium]